MPNPLLTFVVCAYNQEQFIREAVEGALAQTYSPLEILLTDDCSPDRTFQIMQEMAAAYRGPHQVVLNRNPKNIGVGAHVNRLCELSKGELIVCAGGDDISFKERTERIYRAWEKSSRTAFSIYSNMIIIDSSGAQKGIWNKGMAPIHVNSLSEAAHLGYSGVYGCTHAFHRKVFEVFGPLDESIIHEDVAIPFRSLFLGTIKYLEEPLVYYRRHGNNVWSDAIVHSLKKRRQILRSDQAYLLSWIRDLEKSRRLGILSEIESEGLQEEIIEHIRERSVEGQYYKRDVASAYFHLLARYFGWRNFRQFLSLSKRRWQSRSHSGDAGS
ncbi:MAG TPA: glycosyltransferase [Verrucomicrobiae bacterium]|jgi:glycosyltransferase involved in cell wall biosynthesis